MGDVSGVVAEAGKELPLDRQPQRQQQQQQLDGVGQDGQQNLAANMALLLDQQRSLLAALRQVEREVQQAEGAPSGADRRELDRARKGARQAVIQAAEVVVSAGQGNMLSTMCRSSLAFELISLCVNFRLSIWFHWTGWTPSAECCWLPAFSAACPSACCILSVAVHAECQWW
jgi:DNA-binding helix-hairpin-helix protein with protein kinase domain